MILMWLVTACILFVALSMLWCYFCYKKMENLVQIFCKEPMTIYASRNPNIFDIGYRPGTKWVENNRTYVLRQIKAEWVEHHEDNLHV